MPNTSSRLAGYFDARSQNRSIAKLYGDLDEEHRQELVERFTELPRQIHSLAMQGLIPSVADSDGSNNDDAGKTIDALSWSRRIAL